MRLPSAIFVLSLVLTLSGCNVMGVAAHAIGGPDVPAQYVLAKKPTAVIVKDLPDPSGRQIESEQIAAELDRELKIHDLVPMVSLQKVADWRSAAASDAMSPAKIARSAGAEQAIYVEIFNSSLDAGPVSDMIKGELAAIVSVIDTSSGDTLWPTDGSLGVTVSCSTPTAAISDDINRKAIRGGMDAELAQKIASLFYKHKSQD